MTCIAAIADKGTVWVGGDSAGVGGIHLMVRDDPKVFQNGDFVFGFTTSFRMGQLLHYSFTPPDRDPRQSLDKYMATSFIDSVRKCFKDGGVAEKHNDVEECGTFIVGYEGHIFTIYDNYQVARPRDNFASVGCGYELAIGSLCCTEKLKPEQRIKLALETAERYSAGVRGPFKIINKHWK